MREKIAQIGIPVNCKSIYKSGFWVSSPWKIFRQLSVYSSCKTIYPGVKRQNFLRFIKKFWIQHPLCFFTFSPRFEICLKIFLAWYMGSCNPDMKLLTKISYLQSSFVSCMIFACSHFVLCCYSSWVVWKKLMFLSCKWYLNDFKV